MSHQNNKIERFSVWSVRVVIGLLILAILLGAYNIIAVQHNIKVQTEWRQCFKDFSGDEETECVRRVDALRLPTVQSLFMGDKELSQDVSVDKYEAFRRAYEENYKGKQ